MWRTDQEGQRESTIHPPSMALLAPCSVRLYYWCEDVIPSKTNVVSLVIRSPTHSFIHLSFHPFIHSFIKCLWGFCEKLRAGRWKSETQLLLFDCSQTTDTSFWDVIRASYFIESGSRGDKVGVSDDMETVQPARIYLLTLLIWPIILKIIFVFWGWEM